MDGCGWCLPWTTTSSLCRHSGRCRRRHKHMVVELSKSGPLSDLRSLQSNVNNSKRRKRKNKRSPQKTSLRLVSSLGNLNTCHDRSISQKERELSSKLVLRASALRPPTDGHWSARCGRIVRYRLWRFRKKYCPTLMLDTRAVVL